MHFYTRYSTLHNISALVCHESKKNIKKILLSIIFLSVAACGGGGGGEAVIKPQQIQLKGSVGDGPVTDATITVTDSNGDIIAVALSDATASYNISIPDNSLFPVIITATGGTDIVTGDRPDFTMISTVVDKQNLTAKHLIANVNPFSTFMVKMSRVMRGGLTRNNLDSSKQILLQIFNFGFDADTFPDPISSQITTLNVASVVKSSEAMGEMIRRTRDTIISSGSLLNGDDIINALSNDIADGKIDGVGMNANARITATAKIISAQVMIEVLGNRLKVKNSDSTALMDNAIKTTQPDSSMTTDNVVITTDLITQTRDLIAAAKRYHSSNELAAIEDILSTLNGDIFPSDIKKVLPTNAENFLDSAIMSVAIATEQEIGSINIDTHPAIPLQVAPGDGGGDDGSAPPCVDFSDVPSVVVDPITVCVTQPESVTTDHVLSSKITLRFDKGGYLDINSGVTMTVNGPVAADPTAYIFRGGSIEGSFSGGALSPMWFGAAGDSQPSGEGSDDSAVFSKILTLASDEGLEVRIPRDRWFRITKPLFMWGAIQLVGAGSTGTDVSIANEDGDLEHVGSGCNCGLVLEDKGPYLVNFGISQKVDPSNADTRHNLRAVFTGSVRNIGVAVVPGGRGRAFFFWRTRGATIEHNTFSMGNTRYSATSSGNDNNWVRNCPPTPGEEADPCIRRDISLHHNHVRATSDRHGSEGIGLGLFAGVDVRYNLVHGVGDDLIAVHFCSDVTIFGNELSGVDGRLFVSNGKNVTLSYNRVSREASPLDGEFHKGIALIYVGWESQVTNSWIAPTNIEIAHNTLTYPPGAIDAGAAIHVYGPRDIRILNNTITNDSATVASNAIKLVPYALRYSPSVPEEDQIWSDSDGLDPIDGWEITPLEPNPIRYRRYGMYDFVVEANTANGAYPLRIGMTGNCVSYKGIGRFANNIAGGYNIYCSSRVEDSNNR